MFRHWYDFINTYSIHFYKSNTKNYDYFIGAISIIGSQHAQSCVGIESVTQAVNDAKETAILNNIHNCDFIEGKIEIVNSHNMYFLFITSIHLLFIYFMFQVLKQVLDELSMTNDLCSVLNPGRAGVRKSS